MIVLIDDRKRGKEADRMKQMKQAKESKNDLWVKQKAEPQEYIGTSEGQQFGK